MNSPAAKSAIRPMTVADLERVEEIARRLQDAPHWPSAAYFAALDAQAALRRIALVAEDAETGAISGFAVASVLPPEAELETLAVAAESQRHGVARQLFTALADELRRTQVTQVMLEVRASNRPALALYRALGFLENGRRPRYYIDPVEDALLLLLRLD
jgi:ribosomal-protein-alanine N-acetyltransferase